MKLRTIFFGLCWAVPIFAQAHQVSELRDKQISELQDKQLSELQAKSVAVSKSIVKSVVAEQTRNAERIRIQLRIDQLRSEAWQPDATQETRQTLQRELARLHDQLNKL